MYQSPIYVPVTNICVIDPYLCEGLKDLDH